VKLPFGDVPAQPALFDGFAHVSPFESVLSVVVVVEVAEEGWGSWLKRVRAGHR